jgi:carboxyl-terminal processing protease
MTRFRRNISVCIAVCLIFGAGYALGTTTHVTPAQAQGGQPAGTQRTFAPFWESYNLIKRNFVNPDKVDDELLMEAALRGMVNSLDDENTGYMPPTEFAILTGDDSGEYDGIGATVRKDDATGGARIVSTTLGSPARELLRQGDIIVRVEGQDITDLSLNEAVTRIRGPQGTSVTLGVIREGVEGILDVVVARARIKREIVTAALYEGNIGYVSLAEFTTNAARELRTALTRLDANDLDGLVLDLRNDPGGDLYVAIEVASQFLRSGTVLIQRGRPGTREIRHAVTGRGVARDVPLVVIVNEASASASELVAGALQDRGRAKVVGTLSFGKGSIQQWSGLSNGGGLRVTIAEFFKPSGGKINKVGIVPDVLVPWTEDQARANPNYDPQLTEAILLLRGIM